MCEIIYALVGACRIFYFMNQIQIEKLDLILALHQGAAFLDKRDHNPYRNNDGCTTYQ